MKAASKPCTVCGRLVADGSSRCVEHQRKKFDFNRPRGTRHERGYGTAWDRVRRQVMERDAGLCQPCQAAGRVTLAKQVDHIVSKADGGTDEEGNLQAICLPCHHSKTAGEVWRRGGGKL